LHKNNCNIADIRLSLPRFSKKQIICPAGGTFDEKYPCHPFDRHGGLLNEYPINN